MLRPCCAEGLVAIGKLLILPELRSSSPQHEKGHKNGAETARNP
jgi:hypothetical protein